MCAVPNTAAFCSFLISCFTGTLLRYCLSDFEMVPVAPVIIGITFDFTFIVIIIIIIIRYNFKLCSLLLSAHNRGHLTWLGGYFR